ncbi:S-adenosyl-L-methionine-dependent methyltransferase [Pilobolus umbonatus]|nr:S-adenosyl-L-methionine-dependent methyltransferase [Pilobolus umbonatus]
MIFPSLLDCFGKRKHVPQYHHSTHKSQLTTDHSESTSEDPTSPGNSEGRKFQMISGRRFNNEQDVAYILPNDDTEADRLHFQHWAIKYTVGGLYMAPMYDMLEKGIRVVDAGCGPATWTFEMAKDYPNSNFIGLDVSFVFPEIIRPPNVDFHICNISKEIPFEDDSIDYYHQRLLVAGLNEDDMKLSLESAYRVMKPGGYIELGEVLIGDVENKGPKTTIINTLMITVIKKKGLNPDIGLLIGDLLKEVGFENVFFEKRPVPIGHTNKAGELWWEDYVELCRSLRPVVAMTNPIYEDPEIYEEFIKSVEGECAENKTNLYYCMAYAQKPLKEHL